MTRDLFINGKDAWVTWGVRMGDGFLDALDGFCEMKEFVADESRLEHGKRVTVVPKVKSREVTLQFTMQGTSEADYRIKKNSFQDELENGIVEINVPVLGDTVYYNLLFKRGIAYGLSLRRDFGKISCKFEEPNPKDRQKRNKAQNV